MQIDAETLCFHSEVIIIVSWMSKVDSWGNLVHSVNNTVFQSKVPQNCPCFRWFWTLTVQYSKAPRHGFQGKVLTLCFQPFFEFYVFFIRTFFMLEVWCWMMTVKARNSFDASRNPSRIDFLKISLNSDLRFSYAFQIMLWEFISRSV